MDLSLPFRFDLTEAMAARWATVPDYTKQKWLEEWAVSVSAEGCKSTVRPFAHGAKAAMPGKLDFVRQICSAADISFSDASQSFSIFATKKLRQGKPVKGELELTAEWADANLLPGYKLEVVCDVGRVDAVCYTSNLLVEAKLEGAWKGALGQVLAYRECFAIKQNAGWSSMLLLLGNKTACDARLVTAICERLDVKVEWYNGTHQQKFTSLRENRNK